jgi:hypothetical protein
MPQPKANIPTSAGEVVGAKRGGPAHLVDGIGPGKGVITKRDLVVPLTPEASKILPEGAPPGYNP